MKRLVRRSLPFVAAAIVLGLGLNVWVFHRGTSAIVSFDAATAAPRDTILVLGAGVWSGRPSPVLEDRLATALALHRAGAAPRLLLSGDHGRASYDEPAAMRAWLLERGVPDDVMVLDHAGFDTYSSMVRARDVFGARNVVVVTQRFHLPRATYLARAVGLEAIGVEASERRYHQNPVHVARELVTRPISFLDQARGRSPRYPR